MRISEKKFNDHGKRVHDFIIIIIIIFHERFGKRL